MQDVGQSKLHKMFESDNTRYQNKHISKKWPCQLLYLYFFILKAIGWFPSGLSKDNIYGCH